MCTAFHTNSGWPPRTGWLVGPAGDQRSAVGCTPLMRKRRKRKRKPPALTAREERSLSLIMKTGIEEEEKKRGKIVQHGFASTKSAGIARRPINTQCLSNRNIHPEVRTARRARGAGALNTLTPVTMSGPTLSPVSALCLKPQIGHNIGFQAPTSTQPS